MIVHLNGWPEVGKKAIGKLVQDRADSEVLLAGLGRNCNQFSVPNGFSICQCYIRW